MSKSPLEFTREFARFKSNLTRQPDSEHQLLIMMEFWHTLEGVHQKTEYSTYIEEYIDLLNSLITEQTIYDFTIDELTSLRNILISIKNSKHHRPGNRSDQNLKLVTYKLVTLLFYVGDIETTVPLCLELSAEQNIKLPEIADLTRFDSFDLLAELISYYDNSAPSLAAILKDIYDRWEAERACVNFDRAVCLFVEKTRDGKVERGRLRVLKGTVEIIKSASKDDDDTDAVTFDNQIKTPDDPFIGVAYDSLEAVRAVLKKIGFNRKSESSYRAYFSIDESQQTFTGDSIGLAMGLISYSQLMKTEIMRQQRFVANEVALTGGVDSESNLLPVNKETLTLKVERAFFSAMKYIVVPEKCYIDAKKHIDKLSEAFPRRRLQLIAHSHLANVIDDLNILRSEKVCMSQYITKKAIKYSRAATIQVSLLIVMLYMLTCFIYPKAWIGFDWNPEYIRKLDTGFEAINQDSIPLWSKNYSIEIDYVYSLWDIGDFNNDSLNEVGFLPQTNFDSKINADLYLYNYDGNLRFRKNCAILGEYPGDTTLQALYETGGIKFSHYSDNPYLMTIIIKSYPGRSHIKFWDDEGELIGWYINSGYCGWQVCTIEEKSGRLLFLAMNNITECTALFAISPDSCFGVSPPYANPNLILENVKRGKQCCYILFPSTDLGAHVSSTNLSSSYHNTPKKLCYEAEGLIRAEIQYNPYEKDAISCSLSFFMDERLRVLYVDACDGFKGRRNRLVAAGILPEID